MKSRVRSAAKRAHARLCDWLFGTEVRWRLKARLVFTVFALYQCWLAMMVFVWHLGLLGNTGLQVLALIDTVGPAAFFLLVRSGWSRRFSDSGLVAPQMIYASAVTMTAYAFSPTLRVALAQTLCVVQVFGLLTLRPRQALNVGLAGALLMLATWFALPALESSPTSRGFEAIRLIFSSFIVALLALQSRQYARMRQAVRRQQDKLAAALEQVHELVTRDLLTGVYNRQYMQDRLVRERARLARGGSACCLAMIDLDHFKRINDTYGHRVGDDVLVAFARCAQATLRTTDVLARWGGEEFVVLMPDTDPTGHGLLCLQRLHDEVSTLQPGPGVADLRISFSAGLAGSVDGETLDQMLERADRALYAAKAQGRGRSVLAQAVAATSQDTASQPQTVARQVPLASPDSLHQAPV